jgi:phosphoglycolate phosphatase-like HAD superfamily hydrolase
VTKAVAVDLDGALGDTRPLWRAFVDDAARRFAPIARLDAASLPEERSAAGRELDRWAKAGVGDWRKTLERFAEDHAPVYLRPSPGANTALRALAAAGYRIGVFTDAPEPLARVALAHLGVARHVDVLETGAGARERLLERLGPEAPVATSGEQLVSTAAARG